MRTGDQQPAEKGDAQHRRKGEKVIGAAAAGGTAAARRAYWVCQGFGPWACPVDVSPGSAERDAAGQAEELFSPKTV